MMTMRLEHVARREAQYKRLKMKYRKIEYGSTVILEIDWTNRQRFSGHIGDEMMEGVHIIKLFRDHLVKNKPPVKAYGINTETNLIYRFINKKLVCKENITGTEYYSFDLVNCYWETAKMLNFIDEKLYKSGLRYEKYKTARNAAIGSLMRVQTITDYDKYGNMKKKPVTVIDYELRNYRYAIIEHIYNLAMSIYNAFPDSFLMFLTDCFYVKPDAYTAVSKMIKAAGYQFHKNMCMIDLCEVSKYSYKLNWFNYGSNPNCETKTVCFNGIDTI